MMKTRPERQIELLGTDPSLLALESRLRRGWIKDEEFFRSVERLYRIKVKSLGLDPEGELPLFSIPEDFGDPATGILVGRPVHGELAMPPLHLPLDDLTISHVQCSGKTRVGKSFQIAHLASQVCRQQPHRGFLFYDIQGELCSILANLVHPEKLLWIPVEDYWKNPLQDLHEHGLDKAIGFFKRALLESVFIGDATVNLFEQLVRHRCTAEMLSALGPPILEEILVSARHLAGVGRTFARKVVEYQNSLVNILGNLSLNLGCVYNQPITRGFGFRDFEGRVVVIDLSALKDPIALKFFITKELLELTLYAETQHAPMTVVLDEMHRFAPLEKRYGQYSSPILIDAVKTLLKFDVNFWYAEQNPGMMVSPAIFANTGTHFVFRLPNVKDRWPVLNAINISDREQEAAVGILERQHCLVFSEWLGAAVLIKTPDLDIRDLRGEARQTLLPKVRAFQERFLAEHGVRLERGRSRPDSVGAAPTVQDSMKKRIVEHRLEAPLSGITDTYAAAGVSPDKGRQYVTDLVEVGWLEGPENMPGPGSGPKARSCYVATERGCKALDLDWPRGKLPGKGSLKSRLAMKMIGLHFERKGAPVRYEHTLTTPLANKSADVAVLEPDGSVTAYEYQNSNSHLVENIRRNALAGFVRTVVVCQNASSLARARKLIERELEPELLEQVSLATLKEFAG
ncbi:MAG: hypothetical protein KJ621_10860 [Proteobacteria bacterium]|nr:hypothetical protein [Pseudomonadota bacterium]